MKTVHFSKYSGAGNDFILIDHRAPFLFPFLENKTSFSTFVPKICHRQKGIGADGVILLEKPCFSGDFKMRIYNADGSEAEMCGNGLRTLIKFIDSLGHPKKTYNIETFHSQDGQYHRGSLINDRDVLIEMPSPREIEWGLSLAVNQNTYTVDFLDTGVPHTVLFMESYDFLDIQKLGAAFRHHSHFGKGTNVNFVCVHEGTFYLRTYERGVEAETLACGTGAVASAIALSRKLSISSPISLKVRSADTLTVNFSTSSNYHFIDNVTLSGPAHKIFEGSFNPDFFI